MQITEQERKAAVWLAEKALLAALCSTGRLTTEQLARALAARPRP